jgi:hypothetical protein
MIRRLATVGAAVGALGICPGVAAALQAPVPIGPNQPFVGFVNGSSANAFIRVGCVGPTRPGQTGHPLAGQSMEVRFSNATVAGFTGTAHSVTATITYPAPATSQPTTLASFSNYFVPTPISTQARLPCTGRGTVAFTPMDNSPSARPWDMTVNFVAQP